jgi:hypothetical protein
MLGVVFYLCEKLFCYLPVFGKEPRINRDYFVLFWVQELSLAGNLIGPDGAAAIGGAVGQHPRLRELYLHKNKLGYQASLILSNYYLSQA